MITKSIQELVRDAEANYISGTTTLNKYVEFSLYENTEKIDAYLNSKHISGDTDSQGREKPFFNIVTAAVNIWYRATDIDRKDINIKATKQEDQISAFLATIHLQEYMRRDFFGSFLNDWGRSLARYGSSVVKFVEKGGQLHASVIPWNRLIVDQIDFDNNLKIEKLFYTPAQLRANKSYDKELVEKLIDAKAQRETLDGQDKDNISEYIEVYEVHGELPLSLLTDKEADEDTYQQQMHVISFVATKEKGEFDDYTLVSGRESKDPYMITHLIKEDGRTQGIGAVEHLFEAQWMVNHTAKGIKDQLDLTSKIIFQTSDGSFVGRNAMSSIENGDILIHADNQPLTQINNSSTDITALQNFGTQWQVLANEITSTPDAIKGNTMPSGTAFRQVAILNQESHSLFEIMIENKGLHLEEMMRIHVIPYLKKQMNTSEEVAATLTAHNLTKIDSLYVPNKAVKNFNERSVEQILSGDIENLQVFDQQAEEQEVKQGLASQGNQRFIKPDEIPTVTWKKVFKNLEWDVEVDVTGESTDKNTILTTLTTVLQTLGGNPAILQDENMRLVFNKIMTEVGGISPVELSQSASQPQQPARQIQGQEVAPATGSPEGIKQAVTV
jgi:hypothetical protein